MACRTRVATEPKLAQTPNPAQVKDLTRFQMRRNSTSSLVCFLGITLVVFATLHVVMSRYSVVCKQYPRSMLTLLTYAQFLSLWSKEYKTLKTRVPPFLWRTGWYQLSELPDEMVDSMATFTEMAPGWIQVYCNDTDQENFLREFFPSALEPWKSLHVPAFRADIWRLLVLDKFGGLYVDLAQSLLKPLDTFFDPDEDQFMGVLDRVGRNKVPRLFQAILGAYPHHPLIVAMANKVIDNVRAKIYGDDPLDITGPTAVGRVVSEVLGTSRLPPVGKHDTSAPLMTDDGRLKMTILEHKGCFRVMGLDGSTQVFQTKMPDYDRLMYPGHRKDKRYDILWRNRTVYGEEQRGPQSFSNFLQRLW